MSNFNDFKTLLTIKRYSNNSISSYIQLLKNFQDYLTDKLPINKLDNKHLFQKIREFLIDKKYAYTTQKQFLSALKLYMLEMYKKELDLSTLQPKKPQRILPEILSKQEVERILNRTKNKKHKAMLAVLYSLGLRTGELINLKIKDLDKHRNIVLIKNAKGRKDRIVPYPEVLKPILRSYYEEFKPNMYLFEGQKKDKYSAVSLRAVFRKACKRANIKKYVVCHSLRHTYATHLLESGTNLKLIQELLGHNNIKTTMLYTKVSNTSVLKATSPMAFLELK